MFNFLDPAKLVQAILGKPQKFPIALLESPKETSLPEIEISPKLQRDLDRCHLDFLAKLFLSSRKSINRESQLWFIEELAYYLRICYPDLSSLEHQQILLQIMELALKEKKR